MLEGEPMSMWLFASYDTANKKLTINESTLIKLQQFSLGQIHIVCNEGFSHRGFNLHRGYSRTKKKRQSTGDDNCIWMRPEPVYDAHISRYIFFMDIESTDYEAMGVLHMFGSLISYVMIIVAEQEQSIGYFGYLPNKLKESSSSSSLHRSKIKGYNANLVCLIPQQGGIEFEDSTSMILNKLNIEGIEDQVLRFHPIVKGYEVNWNSLMNSSRTLEDSLITEVQYMLKGEKGNSQLMYGHIFAQYIRSIQDQINKGKYVDINGIEDEIEIDGAYDAYMAGVKKHSEYSLSKLRNIEQPDDNLLVEVLEDSKKKSIQEYLKRGGAKSPQFREYLNHYTDNVNQRTIENYSVSQRNKNLQILQAESKYVLDRIEQDGLNSKKNSNQLIQKQIDMMKNIYESQARGPEKYSIYNDYMKIFIPVAFSGDKKKQQELRVSLRRNEQLRRKRDELKRKKGGCCSSCSLM